MQSKHTWGWSARLLLLLGLLAEARSQAAAFNETMTRQARYTPNADTCSTTEGRTGTCMTRFHCLRLGGTVKGFCTTYGVCCETNQRCNEVSRLKRTIIRNPAQLDTNMCRYTFEAYSSNVCQLLVQFEEFELQQPVITPATGMAECSDRLEIGGFELCGENSQQHLYIPFNTADNLNYISLTFQLPDMWQQSRWRLVVTQLECPKVKQRVSSSLLPFVNQNSLSDLRTMFSVHHSDLDLLAPPGCDQYFTQPTGNIKSFNYDGLNAIYLANLRYTICIKPSGGANLIEYTTRTFSLSIGDPNGFGYDNDCRSTGITAGRNEDWLMIPQSNLASSPLLQPTYYCGTSLKPNDMVIGMAPFIMIFNSDGQSSSAETGFNINYRLRTTLVTF